ncbi:hypothetical protein HF325_002283 [Metschnikowia pulcherrima]|uniref:DNA-directed RNA polymerase III subunit RPC3 n=1 Tax=Metschnikowia pulcherrima TaxID=27326 RepID=A0A8H7GWJ6_9ASCO|nr:hypothetical protein HF325_002283 [Metschnikowia pulcherrima]
MPSPQSDALKTQSPQLFLYTCLAANHLGDAAATVISTLISYGRSTAREIGTRSRLSQKQVRSALVSLIQLNSVQYWQENGGNSAPVVHYSFNPRGMDVLLHAGDILSQIKTIYGEEYAETVQNVIENGSIAVKDYMLMFEDAQVRLDKMALLVRLYSDGWLRRLQKFEFQPTEDVWNKMYQETLKQMPRLATTSEVKRVAEAKEKTKVKLSALLALGTESKDVYLVENGLQQLRPEITLTFNLSRYEKAMRSRAFVALANLRLGLVTAQIYAACCALIEQKSPDLHHAFFDIAGLIVDPEEEQMFSRLVENALVDGKQTVFSIRDVARHLSPNLDLRNSILTQNFLKPGKRSLPLADEPLAKKIKLEDGSVEVPEPAHEENFDLELENGSADMHLETLIAEHMRLLAGGKIAFVFETAPGLYLIPFIQVLKSVRQFHYDALIKTTLGANALRVLKCIKQMKLVDEKAISNTVLLKDKSVKNEVYKLVTANAVEIQEVPRSADRAALKTFYLFRHKEAPSYAFVSKSLLHSMGTILSNVEQFKAEHRILLDKCEREDVKGHEEELLLESELKTLRDLQVREISNIGRFNRIKWIQFIFGKL